MANESAHKNAGSERTTRGLGVGYALSPPEPAP